MVRSQNDTLAGREMERILRRRREKSQEQAEKLAAEDDPEQKGLAGLQTGEEHGWSKCQQSNHINKNLTEPI